MAVLLVISSHFSLSGTTVAGSNKVLLASLAGSSSQKNVFFGSYFPPW